MCSSDLRKAAAAVAVVAHLVHRAVRARAGTTVRSNTGGRQKSGPRHNVVFMRGRAAIIAGKSYYWRYLGGLLNC